MNMKISIITITYNSAKTLPNTFQSVLSQTYPHIEHIIVDGASTDESVEIIRKYENTSYKIYRSDRRIFYGGEDICTYSR